MKILFVSSGNKIDGIDSIIRNQGESLIKYGGIELDYYTIKGKGIKGYLKAIKPLRKQIRQGRYDIIHAHYSLSAFVASLAGAKRLIVSLMGSDVKANSYYKIVIKLFAFLFCWKSIIVKSDDMKSSLGMQRAVVIPNGVDFERFFVLDKHECREKLGWGNNKIHILFPANPERKEKNYILAEESIKSLLIDNIEIHSFKNIPNTETPLWYNASDIVVLSSLWEGSPNAIKEAMACNCPIVTTNVGDIKWLFGKEKGFYLTDFTEGNYAQQIKKAIAFSKTEGKTNGRERIKYLQLDAEIVAKKIIGVYTSQNDVL